MSAERKNKLVGPVIVTRNFRTDDGEFNPAKQWVAGVKATS